MLKKLMILPAIALCMGFAMPTNSASAQMSPGMYSPPEMLIAAPKKAPPKGVSCSFTVNTGVKGNASHTCEIVKGGKSQTAPAAGKCQKDERVKGKQQECIDKAKAACKKACNGLGGVMRSATPVHSFERELPLAF